MPVSERTMHNLALLALLAIAALVPFLFTLEKHQAASTLGLEMMAPLQVGDWQQVHSRVPDLMGGNQAINEMFQSLYFNQISGYLLLTLEYSSDSRRKYELHFPAICQAARGDTVIEYPVENLVLGNGSTQPMAFLSWQHATKPQGAQCAYWYVVGGTATVSTLQLKVKQALAGLLHKPEDSVLVRIDAIYEEGMTETGKADKRHELKKFAQGLYNELKDQPRRILYGH
jgi:EpsI family protein